MTHITEEDDTYGDERGVADCGIEIGGEPMEREVFRARQGIIRH
jgi:hypothetical protein